MYVQLKRGKMNNFFKGTKIKPKNFKGLKIYFII